MLQPVVNFLVKKSSRTLLIAAALSGLVSGTAIQQGHADPTNAAPGQVAPSAKVPHEESCAGSNDCKGLGGCKTDAHACKFQNSCKGKGGCEITQKDIQAWQKKQQDAAGKTAAKDSTPKAPGQ
jgi:hypothetical protein